MQYGSEAALFLDRDGVINVDHAYVHRQEDFQFIDGIFKFCQLGVQAGYRIFVVTNQAGIGRGYYTEQQFQRLTDWMCDRFLDEGVRIERVYYCPYHEEHGVGRFKQQSFMRKPNPGMILQAIEEYGIDPARSILVGDKETDIQAGRAAGVGINLLYRPEIPHQPGSSQADAVIHNLLDAVPYLAGPL